MKPRSIMWTLSCVVTLLSCNLIALFWFQMKQKNNQSAVKISEGLVKIISKVGYGPTPQKGQLVTVHCTGRLINGTKFWSTHDPDRRPFSFKIGLKKVIKGWDDGCMTMRLGEIARLICTPSNAYGDGGFPAWGIPPHATLDFEIEILAIK